MYPWATHVSWGHGEERRLLGYHPGKKTGKTTVGERLREGSRVEPGPSTTLGLWQAWSVGYTQHPSVTAGYALSQHGHCNDPVEAEPDVHSTPVGWVSECVCVSWDEMNQGLPVTVSNLCGHHVPLLNLPAVSCHQVADGDGTYQLGREGGGRGSWIRGGHTLWLPGRISIVCTPRPQLSPSNTTGFCSWCNKDHINTPPPKVVHITLRKHVNVKSWQMQHCQFQDYSQNPVRESPLATTIHTDHITDQKATGPRPWGHSYTSSVQGLRPVYQKGQRHVYQLISVWFHVGKLWLCVCHRWHLCVHQVTTQDNADVFLSLFTWDEPQLFVPTTSK